MFVTLFYARLNPATNELVYVNGGHNPPFWYQAETGTLAELKGNGIMLGFDETWQFEQTSVQLKSGDVLALYTDGVTEAVNAHREQYGEERLAAVLREAAADTADGILAAVQKSLTAHMGQVPQFDDITFMIAKCL
jgi:sigma-B regulation protein RsbU (phosphoserine phosphatase)